MKLISQSCRRLLGARQLSMVLVAEGAEMDSVFTSSHLFNTITNKSRGVIVLGSLVYVPKASLSCLPH